jgi:hypothetical protein
MPYWAACSPESLVIRNWILRGKRETKKQISVKTNLRKISCLNCSCTWKSTTSTSRPADYSSTSYISQRRMWGATEFFRTREVCCWRWLSVHLSTNHSRCGGCNCVALLTRIFLWESKICRTCFYFFYWIPNMPEALWHVTKKNR